MRNYHVPTDVTRSECPFVARNSDLLNRTVVVKFVGDSRLRQLHYAFMEYVNFFRQPTLAANEIVNKFGPGVRATGPEQSPTQAHWNYGVNIWGGKFQTQMVHLSPTKHVRY